MDHERFLQAAEAIKAQKRLFLSTDQKLELYSLYKQATIGNNTSPSPGWLEFEARSKWSAWNTRNGINKESAELMYIELVSSVCPSWETVVIAAAPPVNDADEGNDNDEGPSDDSMRINVSRFAQVDGDSSNWNEDERLQSLISSDDVAGLRLALEGKKTRIDLNQHSQLPAIHLACDRSSVEIVRLLIHAGADVNLQDDDGQTCIFNAILREKLDVVKLLIESGARTDITDSSGLTVLAAISETNTSQEILDLIH